MAGESTGGAGEGRQFALRLALFYGAVFASLGIYMPYLPIWLAWRGMTPAEIGWLTACPMFMRVVATPVITFVADRRGDLRETILVASWFGLGASLLLGRAEGFWPILLLVLIFQIAHQSILPLTEAKALRGVRAYDLDYGRIRLWGSVAFILANLAGGMVIAQFMGGAVLVMVTVTLALVVVAAHALPRDRGVVGNAVDVAGGKSVPRLRFADLRRLALSPWFLVLMVASGAIQSSHAVYYAFSALHWRTLGISDGWIGGLWGLGVAAEVGLFAISGRLLRWIGAPGLLIVGGAAGVLRWLAMAGDPSFGWLVVLQCLHALTFGATFLGALNILQSSVPEAQAASAQGLHAALAPGIIMGGVTVMSGQIYGPLQASSFLVMSGIALVGLLFAVLLARMLPREPVVAGKT